MRPDWNSIDLTTKPCQAQLRHDEQTQERRRLTFWIQESAYCIRAPLLGILSIDELNSEEDRQTFAHLIPDFRAALITGVPITDPWQRAVHTLGGISMIKTATQAETKTEYLLFEFAERLRIFGYRSVTEQFPLTPTNQRLLDAFPLARLGCVGKNRMPLIREFGCRTNLGIILTDAPLLGCDLRAKPYTEDPCGGCRLCEEACPCGALQNGEYDEETCRVYRENSEHQLHYSPYSVLKCDACMRVCPAGELGKWDSRSAGWDEILRTGIINY